MPPETCPNCGADVPPRAKACPECGSDESTGWSDDAVAGGLGLPDEEFDYEEYVQREFGGGSRRHHGLRPGWWLVGVLLLVVFVLFFLLRIL